jgi:hypothetical protein
MLTRLISIVAVSTALAAPAFAQSATGSGSITILRPLTLTKNTDLRFGTVVRPSTGSGTAVISAAGARSVTGGVAALSSGDTPQSARFTLNGEGGQSVSLTIPATFAITNPDADTLTVTTSNDLTGSAAAQSLSNAIGAAGSLVVNVGGSVPVAATTATGLYTGTFTVSAAYN